MSFGLKKTMMALTYCDKFDDMYVRFDTPALDKQAYSRIEILHQCRASVYCRVIEKYAAFTEPPGTGCIERSKEGQS